MTETAQQNLVSLLVSHLGYILITSLTLTFIISLLIFCLIKLFQVKNQQFNNQKKLNEQTQKILEHRQSMKLFYEQLTCLQQNKQTFTIYYSLYKQLLYLKSGMYHGTSLTSIFGSLKKERPFESEKGSIQRRNKEHSSHNRISFEDRSIQNLRLQIQASVRSLLQTIQALMYLTSSPKLTLSPFPTSYFPLPLPSVSLYSTPFAHTAQDLSTYNIPLLEKRSKILYSTEQLTKNLELSIASQSDEHYMDLITQAMELTKTVSGLVRVVGGFCEKFEGDGEQREGEEGNNGVGMEQLEDFEVRKVIGKVSGGGDDQQDGKGDYVERNSGVVGRICTQLKIFVDRKRNMFSDSGHHYVNYIRDKVNFLNRQIHQLQTLSTSINLQKRKFQQLHLPTTSPTFNHITIYSSSTYPQQPTPPLFPPQHSPTSQSTFPSSIHQSSTQFTPHNKLSFIKQLDRLMVRNRVRREMEEMERVMKEKECQEGEREEEKEGENIEERNSEKVQRGEKDGEAFVVLTSS